MGEVNDRDSSRKEPADRGIEEQRSLVDDYAPTKEPRSHVEDSARNALLAFQRGILDI